MFASIKFAIRTIYTLFINLFTLVSFSKGPRLSVTPFPVDLESGLELQEPSQAASCVPSPRSVSILPGPNQVTDHHCFSPRQTGAVSGTARLPIFETRKFSPSPTTPPRNPLPPLQRFVFPAYPSFRSNSDSFHSVIASPVSRPGSARSASSSTSDGVRSQSSSAYSSQAHVTPPAKKKTHRKQSPIVWFKSVPTGASGSSSSLSSLPSVGSSVSIHSLHRHRSIRRNSFQGIKRDPSLSYRRFTARSSCQSRVLRPHSEDPVSIVRKVFVECGTEVDTEGGGARARLINRETVRSFGGMEIVNEEEEEEELFSARQRNLRKMQESVSASSCSTPESAGPPTPAPHCDSVSPAVASACLSEVFSDISLPPSMSSHLPYLCNRASLGLGISLPSAGFVSSKVQNSQLTTRSSSLFVDQRVSVVTWSDLVSFSSYGLNVIDDIQEKDEMDNSTTSQEMDVQELKREGNEEPVGESRYLDNDSVEESSTDLAAVLDSISILVEQGLDARLLLSPPRQFRRIETSCP
ncbi:hypothetical protein GYMLUDRAFT_238137 [Collybiopsis luxurians FD-317 M1]|nr:hypothetical protein GYMLUDRAFT_238137 [Collybiopsis luxurians FD-317 M1]